MPSNPVRPLTMILSHLTLGPTGFTRITSPWLARPVVIFADSPNDPRFRRQLELLADRAGDLADRDVIILTDTDPAAQSMLRERLRPRGFALVLIGKDGNVVLRKPNPWTAREISRSIDKMPLRQQEVEDRRAEP